MTSPKETPPPPPAPTVREALRGLLEAAETEQGEEVAPAEVESGSPRSDTVNPAPSPSSPSTDARAIEVEEAWAARYEAEAECERLRKECERLRELLDKGGE